MRNFNYHCALTGTTPGGDRARLSGASLLIPPALVFLVGLVTMLASAPDAAAVEVEARVVKVIDGCRDLNKNGTVDPYENWKLPVEKRVEDLLSQMTLKEKIGQTSYPGISFDPEDRSTLVVTDGGIKITAETEVNNGAGFMMACHFPSAGACAENLNLVQSWAENTRLGIPLIFGIDPHPQTLLEVIAQWHYRPRTIPRPFERYMTSGVKR